MLRVGLTGGLACGKSTVAALLEQKGCGLGLGLGLINADRLGHEAIVPGGPAYDAVVAEFGREILDGDGGVNRKRLAALVFGDAFGDAFGDPQRVRRLNELVHPHILRAIEDRVREFTRTRPGGILVIEAALLLEAFAESRVDKVVVVDCTEQQQVERFLSKGADHTAEQARRRMAAQMSRAERLARADFVIDATGTLDETRRRVDTLYEQLVSWNGPERNAPPGMRTS